MGYHQTKKCLHSKGNHQQNKKTAQYKYPKFIKNLQNSTSKKKNQEKPKPKPKTKNQTAQLKMGKGPE